MSRNGKKKKTAGDYLLTLVLIIAIGVFCFAGYNLYHIYTEYKKGTDEYNRIAQMAVTEREPEVPEEAVEEEQQEEGIKAPIEIDFDSLRAVNEDVIGWIYVEAMPDINYTVVKGKDNEEYLHATYEKNYNFAGTIFIDYENAADFSDCNTIVYGHNMKNGSMFGHLKNFIEKPEETYGKSRYIWILTPERNLRYDIMSAYTTGVNSETYTLFKGPGEEFLDWMGNMIERSEIETVIEEPVVQDKVITLSTCTGNSATRFVVQGKLSGVETVRKD